MKSIRIFAIIGATLLASSLWAGSAESRARAFLKGDSPTGSGKVYVALSASTEDNAKYKDCSTTENSISEESKSGANTTTSYDFYAKANTGYKFTGWYSKNADGTYTLQTSAAKHTASVKSGSAPSIGTNTAYLDRYAGFLKVVTYSFIPPVNGSFTITNNGSTVPNYASFEVAGVVKLKATAASGYRFKAWYTTTDGGTTKTYFSFDQEVAPSFAEDATIGCEFGPDNGSALLWVKGGQLYEDLKAANTEAAASSSKQIIVVANGTIPAGDYTISSGVTLLIPFDADYTLKTTDPGHAYSAPTTPSAFRKLTLASGAHITVQNNGAISCSATSQGGQPYGGCVLGKYGQIDMLAGSTITLNSGANLYCWGYITGAGEITAESGSKVYEDFQVACWRGGSAASGMNNNTQQVFPLGQYYIQNIEAKLHLRAGASEYVWTSVSANSDAQRPGSAILLIGSTTGLFRISSGTLTKWYNPTEDRQMYEVDGNTSIGSISMTIYITINSAKYVLPLTNNMDITVKSGTLSCNEKIAILPGARITINEGANVSFGSSGELYVYDKDEWGVYNYYTAANKGAGYLCEANYSPSLPGIHGKRTFANMTDAVLDINGTLTTSSGHFYTTTGKANVCSSNGTGRVTFKKAAGTKTETYQAAQSGTSISYVSIGITNAQLHNADDSYTATTKLAAGKTVDYKNGHWGWAEIWKDGTTILATEHTCAKVNNAAAKNALLPDAPTGYTIRWETTEDTENQEVIHSVHAAPINCTITWKDGTTVIKSETVGYGTRPAFDYQKAPSARWIYVLTGWSDGKQAYAVDNLPLVTGDATYTAQFQTTPKTYTIRFLNDDNEVLQSSEIQYGYTPEYEGATPESTLRDGYLRAFSGWTPGIADVDADADYTATYDIISSLLITDDQTITMNGTVETTVVKVSGRLTVEPGNTLTTEELIMEAGSGKSGHVRGSIAATNAYLHLSIPGGYKAHTWYSIAVPWTVNVPAYAEGDLSLITSGDEYVPQVLGATYDLIYYNGALRARQGHSDACWQYVEDDASSEQYMRPGRAYMIYLTTDAQAIRLKRQPGAELHNDQVTLAKYSQQTGNARDADWNGIGNPAIYQAYINVGATEDIGQIYNAETQAYRQFNMRDSVLMVGQAIFVQPSVSGAVVVNADEYSPFQVQMRASTSKTMSRVVVMMLKNGVEEDRVILRANEKKADSYIVGYDLSKVKVSPKIGQMWVNRYGSQLCIHTAVDVCDVADFPLAFSAPQTDEYELSVIRTNNSNDQLYLTYDNQIVWDFRDGSYVLSLDKGTNTHYGMRMLREPIASSTVETRTNGSSSVRKIIYNDKVYILRDGKIYTVTGQQIISQ